MSEHVVPFGPSGPDPERVRRHLAWFNEPGNARRLADGALEAWREDGRGFWAISDLVEPNDDGTVPMAYIPLSKLGTFYNDEMRQGLERMVRSYDPRYQVVIAIEDEGKVSTYKVRFFSPQDN